MSLLPIKHSFSMRLIPISFNKNQCLFRTLYFSSKFYFFGSVQRSVLKNFNFFGSALKIYPVLSPVLSPIKFFDSVQHTHRKIQRPINLLAQPKKKKVYSGFNIKLPKGKKIFSALWPDLKFFRQPINSQTQPDPFIGIFYFK